MQEHTKGYIKECVKVMITTFSVMTLWLILRFLVVGNLALGLEDFILVQLGGFLLYFKTTKRNILLQIKDHIDSNYKPHDFDDFE